MGVALRWVSRTLGVTVIAASGVALLLQGVRADAQPQGTPLFFDSRRLPDMEVERRNQDVALEQRRAAEEQRLEAESATRRLDEEAKVAAAAEKSRKLDEEKNRATAALAAQRKADDDKRATELAVKKQDEQRIAEAAAQAARKVEDEKRLALELDAKKKEEAARVAALEAQRKAEVAALEVQRKAEEDKRIALAAERLRREEAEARKRDEDEKKRLLAEADAKRQAEEVRVAETQLKLEAQRKADEQRRADIERRTAQAAAAAAAASAAAKASAAVAEPAATQTAALAPTVVTPVAVIRPESAPSAKLETGSAESGSCNPATVQAKAVLGGRVQVAVDSECRRSQKVVVRYGSYELSHTLDAKGHGDFMIDLFLGRDEGAQLGFADGTAQGVPATSADATEVAKVAVIWTAPVDLDLHAYENGLGSGKLGHLWSGRRSTAEAAKAAASETGRGAGFISSVSDASTEGTRIEVYTYFPSPDQDSAAVSLTLDYATRGSTPAGPYCGQSALAEVPFEVVSINARGEARRESGRISAAKCDDPLSEAARHARGVVPDLRFRR